MSDIELLAFVIMPIVVVGLGWLMAWLGRRFPHPHTGGRRPARPQARACPHARVSTRRKQWPIRRLPIPTLSLFPSRTALECAGRRFASSPGLQLFSSSALQIFRSSALQPPIQSASHYAIAVLTTPRRGICR